jgi:hypothetical protein
MYSVTESRTAEVPVTVDETTKWINGVTGQTTCDDIIDAILARQARKGKVSSGDMGQIGLKTLKSQVLYHYMYTFYVH